MDEIWKPIPGYEGYYEANNLGRIRSVDRYTRNRWGSKTFHKSQFMKCRVVTNGYTHVKLTKKGKKCEPLVHRIIASLFVPNIDNLPQVNHIDGNKKNNCASNLEWCTNSENHVACHAKHKKLTSKIQKNLL